jgi:Flp pilus assembly protein TadG
VLLLMLFLALMSVGLWAYTRTLLTSAAADAARVAANYDAADAVATAQVAELLGDGITGSTRSTLACSSAVTGLLVTVDCTMESPGIIGLLDGVMPTALKITGTPGVTVSIVWRGPGRGRADQPMASLL